MYDVPQQLLGRPFHRSAALRAGLPRGVLQGRRFRRLHESVYCASTLELSFADRVLAARLALPPGARTTRITRLQELGLDHGPRSPLHFVVEGDHHLALDGVFLHRTVKMPPCDSLGVSVEAAYVACCAEARMIDAIKVPEAELLTLVRFAGLPEPAVNEPLVLPDGTLVTPDLWFAPWRGAVEYEGSQHQEDRAQYNADIDRYAGYRRNAIDYALITKEVLALPRTAVRRVHRLLVDAVYDGTAPDFGPHWQALFRPLRDVVRPFVPRQR